MKKNIGSRLALYPIPGIVISAMNENKPAWPPISYAGITGHGRITASLPASHFISGIIKENKKFSMNIIDEEILPKADYAGSVSGAKTDKSQLFEYEFGDAHTPIILKPPLSIECNVVDI